MTRGITKASIPLMSIAIGISLLLFHLFQGSQLDFPGHPVKSYPSILGPVRFPEASLLEEPTQLWSKSANDAESAAIVLASTTKDDVTWINSFQNSSKIFVYTADDPDAGLSVPVNRGHEAMVYLTYIIDHYFQLPSVVVFMHAHRFTWHNPVMFGFDSFELVQRLNLDRVRRIKYMNVRCEQDPGCPDWLHLDEEGDSLKHQEQRIIATCWKELFPFDEMPKRLAQPCCGQFAVARDRLQAIPLSRFVYYRDWLLRTELTDYFSGRMFEFSWQYIFTGKGIVCPDERECFCDGFGICFAADALEAYKDLLRQSKEASDELATIYQGPQTSQGAGNEGGLDLARKDHLLAKVNAVKHEMQSMKDVAMSRSKDDV